MRQKAKSPITKKKAGTAKVSAEKYKSTPIHVMIRVRSESGTTFKAHQKIINSKGKACLGKMGQGLGPDFIGKLNEQISKGLPTYLFLTTREGWNGPYVAYQCRLAKVETEIPASSLSLVPTYYASEHKKIKTWFEILSLEKMPRAEMNRLVVISSGRPIMSVVNSSASVFRVAVQHQSLPTS